MADWGAGWRQAGAAVSDAFNMYAGMKMDEQRQTKDDARRIAAERAQELKEERRRKLEEAARQSRVAQTYTNPETGEIVPVRQGEIESGLAKVPRFELDRIRAKEDEERNKAKAADDRAERAIRVQEQYASRATQGGGGGLAGSAPSSGFNQKDVDSARQMLSTLMKNEDITAAQAEERVAQMYSEEVAQLAFPGRRNRIGQAAQTLNRGAQSIQGLSSRIGQYFQ